jgi:hypothetical protein
LLIGETRWNAAICLGIRARFLATRADSGSTKVSFEFKGETAIRWGIPTPTLFV